MKQLVLSVLFASFAVPAFATTQVRLLNGNAVMPQLKIQAIVSQNFDLTAYREVGVQAIPNAYQPHHLLVRLHYKGTHRLGLAAIYVDNKLNVTRVDKNYHPTAEDKAAQPGQAAATCPDSTVQFIAFAPNDDDTEQGVTVAVANAATAAGFKVVQLLKADATRANYLAYMACPNVVGNFYDGDSNPDEFVTVDGMISSTDMATFNFNYKMVNIWVACEAFNDPMKSTMLSTAKAQKYAAGINDLEVGPSDQAAECAMIAAVQGKPMTAAFQACLTQYDSTAGDQWGFDGSGSDQLGQ